MLLFSFYPSTSNKRARLCRDIVKILGDLGIFIDILPQVSVDAWMEYAKSLDIEEMGDRYMPLFDFR
jgi:hypothetical protein